jgi:hypothetical protein
MSLFETRQPATSPPPEPGAGGYDRMGVPGPDGALRWLTKGEFEKLPLVERVRILSTGSVRFFRQGRQIPPREALRGN